MWLNKLISVKYEIKANARIIDNNAKICQLWSACGFWMMYKSVDRIQMC